MAQQTLNDGVSFGEQRSKINSNFTELYSTKTNNSNAAIVGGTIDGTSIGQTTPAAGAFTSLSASGSIFTSSGIDINSPAGGTWSNYTAADGSLRWYKAGDKLQLSSIGLALDGSLSTTQGATFGGSVTTDTGLVLNEELSSLSTRWITGGYAAASNSGYGARIGFESNANSFASAVIVLQYANGAGNWTEMARFDKGNLGLGVTPSNHYAGGYGGPILQIGAQASILGSAAYSEFCHNVYYADGYWRYIGEGTALSYRQNAGVHSWHSAPVGIAGQPISFTQAMTLDASGNLLNNTTSYALSNDDNVMIGGPDGVVYVQHSNGRVSGSSYINFNYNSSIIGSITQNGTTAIAYNTTSDHRLKENIRPANAGRFNDIKFVDFEWIDGRHDCGVIAHQLQEIYPDLVIGEKDATEIRKVEITPAVPAVTEQKLVSEAIFNEDGEEIEPAVYETIEITPAVEAVFEDQEFPVYQQVNYIGLIGRIGTRIQMLDKLATEQAEVISKLEARLSAIEAKLN